ncbi:MAG TPA: hypothetical protein PLV75_09715, partial [Saprospiraceae bacterium]|nr:hypothetical protein [Saprospiraceae bacterium]
PVAMLIYGVHQPNFKSDEAVLKYAGRLGLQGVVYRLEEYGEESLPRYRYTANSMPGMLLFNSAGQLTKFELNCGGDLDSIAKLAISDIDQMQLTEKSLEDFLKDTYVINGQTNPVVSEFDKPLYAIKFAEFAGKLNKDHVPGLVKLLESRKDVDYILLNVDYSVKK